MRKFIPILSALAMIPFASAAMAEATSGTQQNAGPYAITETFHIGGEGSWDYLTVDPEHKLLYVPRTSHTLVISAKDGSTVADIPGQKRNHGVALVPELGRGYISDGNAESVTIFDSKTNEVLGTVQTAKDADGIAYDPASKNVFVVCGTEKAVYPFSADIDPKNGKADAPIELGGEPEFLTSDGAGHMYINLMTTNEVAVVDSKEMKVVNKWPVAPGGVPVGMAIDPEKKRIYIGCRKPEKLIVMSIEDGKVLADLPIGAGVDAVKIDGEYILASCRDGSLAVVKETEPGKFEVVQTVTTKVGARTMGVDPETHKIYLPTAEYDKPKDAKSKAAAKPNSFLILVVSRTESPVPTPEGLN